MPLFGLLKAYRGELVFLLLMGVVYAIFLNAYELNAYTELPLFEAAREALSSQTWNLPTFQHNLGSPLMTMLVTLAFKFWGTTVGAARIPALLLSMLCLALTYVFCLLIIKNRMSALLSAVVLATSLGFFGLATLSGQGVLLADVFLIAFISIENWRNLSAKRKASPGEDGIACGWLGFSLALLILAQGWLALGWLTATLALFFMVSRAPLPRVMGHWSWTGFLLGLALPIGSAFALASLIPGGWPQFGAFLLSAGIDRLSWFESSIGVNSLTLLIGVLPYTFFLGGFVLELFRYRRIAGPSHLGQEPLWLLGSFLLMSFLFSWAFSPAHTISLLIPSMVPLACFTGSYMARFFDGEQSTDTSNWAMELTIVAIAIGAVLLTIVLFNVLSETHPVGFWRFPGPVVIDTIHFIKDIPLDPPFPVWKLWLSPGPFILLITAVTLYSLHTMRRYRQAGIVLVAFWLVFLLFMKLMFIPLLQRPIHRQNAQIVKAALRPGSTLWLDETQQALMPMIFFLNLTEKQPVLLSKNPAADLSRWIETPMYRRLVGVMSEEDYYRLSASARENIRILSHRWSWVPISPSHLPQLFNADYMHLLTYNTLVFETLPKSVAIDVNHLAQPVDDDKKAKRNRRR